MLLVNEIYPAICGESRFSGQPCTLVRLTGCHLRCAWCDSEHSFQGGERLDADAILEVVRGHGFPTVLVTGGRAAAAGRRHGTAGRAAGRRPDGAAGNQRHPRSCQRRGPGPGSRRCAPHRGPQGPGQRHRRRTHRLGRHRGPRRRRRAEDRLRRPRRLRMGRATWCAPRTAAAGRAGGLLAGAGRPRGPPTGRVDPGRRPGRALPDPAAQGHLARSRRGGCEHGARHWRIVLVSGGLDSCVCLAEAAREHDAGPAARELRAAHRGPGTGGLRRPGRPLRRRAGAWWRTSATSRPSAARR